MSTPEKKILIVEDEQLIAHSIERSLFKAGYSVPAMAASAQEAFERIEETKPDLVLMDIHIQGPCDGVETAKMIRERYHLPIIYLTAHADADTLERAKITEPLGYLVKPVNHANLPSSIEMALYKHNIDRQLEENRALLETILASIAEAVIVTDSAGQVQFLNKAAEVLTGWPQAEALNRTFEEVVPLDSGTESSLLLRALTSSRTIPVPRDTTLQTKKGPVLFVDGQIAVSRNKGRAAGAMVTLHDATVRREEELRSRQEQRMLSVGQMANDIANDFYGLFDLIASFSEQLSDEESDQALVADIAGYISRTSRAGVSLSRQLLDLGKNQGSRPGLINLNEILSERQPLYNHLCGAAISVETKLRADLDLVLNHPLHLEKLVLNLVLSAKHSMPYGGKIVISTSNIRCPGEKGTADKQFVQLLVESHRNAGNGEEAFAFATQPQTSELTMTVVNAIVAVSEGSISASEESALHGTTEVLLPAVASVTSAGNEAPSFKHRAVLAVGVPAAHAQVLATSLEGSGFLVLQAANVQEASLVANFVEGAVELVVIDSAAVPQQAQRGIASLVGARWPQAKILLLTSGEGNPGLASASVLAEPYAAADVVIAATSLLQAGTQEDQAGQEIVSLSAALLSSSGSGSASFQEKSTTAVPR